VKLAGQWRYVYRADDQFGRVIDVFVSPRRDATAARRFLERAIGSTKVRPAEVTTDQAPVYPTLMEELLPGHGTAPTGTPTTGSRRITVG
jgi:IS6 family transposase